MDKPFLNLEELRPAPIRGGGSNVPEGFRGSAIADIGLRIGTHRWPVRAGDVIACPTGGPETAHQLRNTSADRMLKYLGVSSRVYPDLVEYPDSGKIGAVTYGPEGRDVRLRHRAEHNLDYWDGEA